MPGSTISRGLENDSFAVSLTHLGLSGDTGRLHVVGGKQGGDWVTGWLARFRSLWGGGGL